MVLSIVLGVLAVQCVTVLAVGRLSLMWGDSGEFLAIARQISAGQGFAELGNTVVPLTLRPPGYSVLIALVTLGFRLPVAVVSLVQIGMLVAVAAGVGVFLHRRGTTTPLATAAGILAGAMPPLGGLALMIKAEVPGLFFAMFAAFALVATGHAASSGASTRRVTAQALLAGLLLGAAVMIRAEYLAVVPFFPFLLPRGIGASRRTLAGLALAAGIAVPVGPWVVHGYRESGRVSLMPGLEETIPMGYLSWLLTWMDHPRYLQSTWWDVYAFGKYDPTAFPDRAFAGPGERARVDSLLAAQPGPALVGSPSDQALAEEARAVRREHPVRSWLVVPVRRLVLQTFFAPHGPPFGDLVPPGRSVVRSLLRPVTLLALAMSLLFAVLLVLGLLQSALALLRLDAGLLAFAALLASRCVVVGWMALPEPRYLGVAAAPAALLAACLVTSFRGTRAAASPST